METTKSKEDLIQELAQFVCTDNYYHHGLGTMKLQLTDGCQFVREQCNAYWLFDLILSHQLSAKVRNESYQVWTLQNQGSRWLMTCDDGNGNVLAKQYIEYSDFPLDKFVVWLEDGIALLPSEH